MNIVSSKNSSGDFFDIKDILKTLGVCISVSAVISTAVPISRNIVNNREAYSNSNNSYSKDINSHEMIYITSAIEETIKKASPYQVENIKRSTIGQKKDEFVMVDVYTKSDDKDKFKLFEAEGFVLSELPENYYVRYF